MSRIEEAVCKGCPLDKLCDEHLTPDIYVNGVLTICTNHFECPAYTCGDGRKDAREQMKTQTPREFTAVINEKSVKILAVIFGRIFAKFKDRTMIASVPEGQIYASPLKQSTPFYSTGQSAFF